MTEQEIIAAYRDRGEPVLHAIDYEDVSLTPRGVMILQQGAKEILRQVAPSMDEERITPNLAVALFVDQLYWDEQSGGLIMCAELAEKSYCLPIPKACWKVRRTNFTERIQ